MPEAQEINAIVVGYTDYSESDRIAKLLSPQLGLISVMGRGARRSKHRLSGVIDLGNDITAQVRQGKGDLWTLSSAQLDNGFLNIRNHIHKLALLSYCCEISSRFGQTNMPAPKLYGLLQNTLGLLNTESEVLGPLFRIGFELKALSFAGLRPPLSRCAICGEISHQDMVYSLNSGGAVHASCVTHSEYTVSNAWIQALEAILCSPLKESFHLKAPSGPQWAIARQIEFHTEGALRSRSFLATLEGSS